MMSFEPSAKPANVERDGTITILATVRTGTSRAAAQQVVQRVVVLGELCARSTVGPATRGSGARTAGSPKTAGGIRYVCAMSISHGGKMRSCLVKST